MTHADVRMTAAGNSRVSWSQETFFKISWCMQKLVIKSEVAMLLEAGNFDDRIRGTQRY